MARDRQEAPPTSGNGGLMLLGGLGLGALIMYLGDPQSGRRRRAVLKDQYVHTAHKVQQGADVVLRDASNRAAGLAASTRGWIQHRHETADDAVLRERVRSALGRETSHPHAIEVQAAGGAITLRGAALAAEADPIVASARKVQGVASVESLLELHEDAGNLPMLQGAGPLEGSRMELMQDNWSPAWRSLAGAIGAGLTMAGWLRGGLNGLAIGTIGGGLLARAATNRDIKSILGIGPSCQGIVVQKAIHIDAPINEVYGHWTIENFPQWMSHVREVTPIGDNRHRWIVDGPAHLPVEWDAEITGMVENSEMSWRSVEGSAVDNAGRVRFSPENGGTRVQVTLCYIPIGGLIGHAVAKALGSDPRSRMDDDLMRFKSVIETGRPPHDAAARRSRAPSWPAGDVRH